MKTDHVDLILEQWRLERPDIDASPMAVMGRLARASNHFNSELQRVFAEFGLNSGEFDVLATLLRSGAPYTLTPNHLLQTLMLSSGAMTNRVDRLEAKKLVQRNADPNDRRGVLVSLTSLGMDLINSAIEQHVKKGEDLLSPLTKSEQGSLAILLKKLLITHESK
ncbi:MarR family winged helix-turn-helix transcriptional regulator [uncultured Shewanella sp.]|uniref:MarR family winged helix-turn-helix transcriptional regulator n=1 Tax=uncultured Shewanella sp. TaxID=173975 RepID=UPI002630CF9C|nr:MarR family transcriptional regulator [uncultured Shewanella sp.]